MGIQTQRETGQNGKSAFWLRCMVRRLRGRAWECQCSFWIRQLARCIAVTPRPKYPALSYVTAICWFGIALSSDCLGLVRYGKLGAR